MIGERTRHALAAAKARGIKLGNPEQAKINRAKAAAQAQVLRPHIERCIKAGRTSSNAIAADLNTRGIAAGCEIFTAQGGVRKANFDGAASEPGPGTISLWAVYS
jgi:hypothetical protein